MFGETSTRLFLNSLLPVPPAGSILFNEVKMKEENLNIFIPEDKFLQIGKRRFKIWISAERSLKATDLFNRISQKGTDENKSITTDMNFYIAMLDVAFLLIQQDFKIVNLFDWIKRKMLTKDYILKHMDIKELSLFIDNALEPIIGTKKKVMEQEEKLTEVVINLIEEIGTKEFVKLLQNSLQTVDTKKVM